MRNRYQPGGPQAETEPGSKGRVLRNLRGIRSLRAMERAESRALVRAQDVLVDEYAAEHRFTAADVCSMHACWLADIYRWAGRYRAVNISKGGFHFAAADRVPSLMAAFERKQLTTFTPCIPGDNEVVARALAIVHAELVLIHPFREGNGRGARILALLMGLQAGLPPLDFAPLGGGGKRRYIAAIHAALDANYEPMIDVFRKVVSRTLRRHGTGGT